MKRTWLGDSIIILLSIAVIVLSLNTIADVTGEPQVLVRTDKGEYIYDLSVDTFATFTGPVGETTIEVRDGKVHVHDSDCRNKVCISAGWVSQVGDWIICLPNNVFVLIEGKIKIENEGGVDDTAF
jgi:hypothetical protein